MELTESIELINKQLIDSHGIDTVTGRPMYRVSWSEDLLEKRLGDWHDFTSDGIYIRSIREVREVRKYNYIKERYILEQLVLVPNINQEELLGAKISYEWAWTFEDRNGNYLPPRIDACRFVIAMIQNAKGRPKELARYVDNTDDPEVKQKRIDKIIEELHGDEAQFQAELGNTVYLNQDGKTH